jgi:hypothetical protein
MPNGVWTAVGARTSVASRTTILIGHKEAIT